MAVDVGCGEDVGGGVCVGPLVGVGVLVGKIAPSILAEIGHRPQPGNSKVRDA